MLLKISCVLACLTLACCSPTKRILMEDNYWAIIQRLDALENVTTALKAENNALRRQHVAFLAELTTDVTGSHHHIYFDNVKLNVGNAYNPHHGTFVAPFTGTYTFSVTACSRTGHYVVLEFTINTAVYGRLLAGDDAYADCNSKTFNVYLNTGDDVFVKHEATGDYLESYAPNGTPSFSGSLLYSD